MNDIREGSIDLQGQTLDLEELDDAYEEDLDKEGSEDNQDQSAQSGGMPAPDMSAGAAPPIIPGAMQ
jgi:hypothetical protein